MKPIKLYIWTHCPFCLRAIELLEKKGLPYQAISLDGKDAELAALRNKTGQRTVPQIFIGEQFIGGYSDLAHLESNNELDALVGNR